MSSFAEKALAVVLLAGLVAVVLLLRIGDDASRVASPRSPEASAAADLTHHTVEAAPETIAYTTRTATVSPVRGSLPLPPDPIHQQEASVTSGLEPPAATVPEYSTTTGPPQTNPTTTTAGADPSVTSTTEPVTESTPVIETVSPTTSQVSSPATTVTPDETEVPRKCLSVQELWVADTYPVEDECTLAEAKRVLTWAWTGTDRQRRSAIRNGHLLDEVFAALDEYGRTHDATLFHPETRGDWSFVFEDIRWRGGPEYDNAVIALTYRLAHRDHPDSESWTETVVQVDGEWKLSYRRSYCLYVDLILEYMGSDLRCPPDPHPEVHEREDQVFIREYEE